MRKLVVVLFLSFLIFGIMLHAPLLIAEEGSSNDTNDDNGSNSDDVNDSEDDDGADDDSNDEDEDEDGVKNNLTREKAKERTREILTKGNCTIKIERTIKIEDGRRVEVVKRKIECADGRKVEVKIKIENRTVDGRVREKIEYESEGDELEVEAEEGIDLEEESNATHYKLRSNGNVTEIKIMPDTASEIALERLRALNFTIELREVKHKNIPRVVYHIESNKTGRFLGIFKFAMKVQGEVDPETGEFLGVSKPWWAFLVAGEDSDQTDEEDDEDNQTVTVELSEQNSSGESGTATLTEENNQTIVSIGMTGFQENVSQPAHIHIGSCPDVGSVTYPLTNVLNGESETILNVTLDQLEGELPLAINVHKSTEEASVYVSCGDIGFD